MQGMASESWMMVTEGQRCGWKVGEKMEEPIDESKTQKVWGMQMFEQGTSLAQKEERRKGGCCFLATWVFVLFLHFYIVM